MAAVAQSLTSRLTPTPNYNLLGSDVDAEGEEDAEGDYEMDAEAQPSEAVTQADKSDEDAQIDSEEEEEEDDGSDATSDVSDKVPKPRGRRARNSDKDAALEDASEAEVSTEGDDDESDKSSSDEESAAAPEWEGGSDQGEEGSVEVANRNNCV